MSISSGVAPISELLEAVRGFTFKATIELWEDAAHTKPLSVQALEGAVLHIVGYETLTVGSGLTLGTGKIEVLLTPTQTTGAPAPQHHYYVSLPNGSEPVCPVRGTITFTNP